MKTTELVGKLKELLGAGTNEGVWEKVQELRAGNEEPEGLVVAVVWRPGQGANVHALNDREVSIDDMARALQEGLGVINRQLQMMLLQARGEAQRLQEELEGRGAGG